MKLRLWPQECCTSGKALTFMLLALCNFYIPGNSDFVINFKKLLIRDCLKCIGKLSPQFCKPANVKS